MSPAQSFSACSALHLSDGCSVQQIPNTRNLDDAPEDSGNESTLVDMELSNLTLRCSGGAKQPPSDSSSEHVSMNDSPIVNEDTTQPTQDERYADVEERARRYNISAEMICLTDYLESRTRVQPSSFHSADHRFETLGRAVGVQKEGENIFVVLLLDLSTQCMLSLFTWMIILVFCLWSFLVFSGIRGVHH